MSRDTDGRRQGRRDPSSAGEGVDGVPVLERTPVETDATIEIETSDVTAWCPYEGTADYYTVRLEYWPDEYAVELMSYRDYFQTYRDAEIGHEEFASRVYAHLLELLEPRWLRLVVEAPPRYGLETTLRHQTAPKPAALRDARTTTRD
jgi:NADPH-dependent 7-cyano-7-deazaguanine reductase QueF